MSCSSGFVLKLGRILESKQKQIARILESKQKQSARNLESKQKQKTYQQQAYFSV